MKELRIFGIEKDKPYPAPGDSIELRMLWHDPAGRSMNRTWFPLCVNPPGDLYYGCFTDPSFFQDASIATGDVFATEVPADIITRRPEPPPGQPKYGLIYAFFTLCSGQIAPDLSPPEGGLPIACLDDAGKRLGPDDFIVGYTSMYVFPKKDGSGFISNQNPPLTGIEIAGKPTQNRTCVDADCVTDPPLPLEPVDCSDSANDPICFDACADDGDFTCPEIPIKPMFDPQVDIAERDEVSQQYYDRDVGEQMWINYFVDRGGTRSEVRLLNDAVEGPNLEWGTDFFAPKDSGPVTIWAIARDNRGGTSWVRTRIGIR